VEKPSKKTITVIEIILIVVAVICINRLFYWFITVKFEQLLDTKGFIEAFYSENPQSLEYMRKKYHLEYFTLQKNRIIAKTDASLPKINPILFDTKKNSEVISIEYKESLKATHPYLSLQLSGMSIVFPLSFPYKNNAYIIFHKVFP